MKATDGAELYNMAVKSERSITPEADAPQTTGQAMLAANVRTLTEADMQSFRQASAPDNKQLKLTRKA